MVEALTKYQTPIKMVTVRTWKQIQVLQTSRARRSIPHKWRGIVPRPRRLWLKEVAETGDGGRGNAIREERRRAWLNLVRGFLIDNTYVVTRLRTWVWLTWTTNYLELPTTLLSQSFLQEQDAGFTICNCWNDEQPSQYIFKHFFVTIHYL